MPGTFITLYIVGIAFTPAVTTTYTVTVISSNGCQNSDDVIVTVNPLPIANAGPDITLCAGQSTTLNATGGDSYTWTSGVINGVPFTPTETATYTVTVTLYNGCTNTDNTTVIVNPLPIANAGPDVSICAGQNVTLSATGGLTYSWTGGVTNGVAFIPTETATYTVTVATDFGCTSTDDVTVSVSRANAGPDVAVCAGQGGRRARCRACACAGARGGRAG